jgi:recombinational DNA repair protein (RecF pathway)
VVLATRVKLMLALGYQPELAGCVQCGADEGLCGFDPSLGGVLCRDCFAEGAHDCFTMSTAGLAALRDLLELPLASIGGVSLEGAVAGEVERALTRVLGYHGH